MNLLRTSKQYIRWYHVVGLVALVVCIAAAVWWLLERNRTASLRAVDETDLVERNA